MDCTPSASPSRAPSGDSFAFPPKREPTPRSATAVAAAAAEPIGAAAAAGAPGRSGGATGAAAPAYDGDGPSALPLPGPAALAQPGAASATAMHKAAMLALQADALHRLRRGKTVLPAQCPTSMCLSYCATPPLPAMPVAALRSHASGLAGSAGSSFATTHAQLHPPSLPIALLQSSQSCCSWRC